jgi:hypothetical protein
MWIGFLAGLCRLVNELSFVFVWQMLRFLIIPEVLWYSILILNFMRCVQTYFICGTSGVGKERTKNTHERIGFKKSFRCVDG